jgi:hypothetical protein
MSPSDVREAVLRALQSIYQPTAIDDLVMVLALQAGLVLTEEAVAELAAADRADFAAGVERPSWICPSLEYENGEAANEFLTRSDWPMGARVVRDVLSETQELWLLRQLSALAVSLAERREVHPPAQMLRLRERIGDLAIHLPPDRLAEKLADRSDVMWVHYELAEDCYGELERQERVAQQHVIAGLEQLALPERFFGVG